MKMLVLTDINSFLKDIWDKLDKFWLRPGGNEVPYLFNFIAAILWLIISYFLIKIITFIIRKSFKLSKKRTIEKTAKRFILDVIRVFLRFFSFIIFFYILRVDMKGMSTVLSSAILAIGLSLQTIVSNFACGLIILNRKYFKAGDFIVVKEQGEGIVKSITFMDTELSTFNGQKVFISNNKIIGNVITNFSSNPTRRIVINLSFSYDADIDKVRELVIALINEDPRVLHEPKPQLVINELNKDGVNYSIRCLTNTNDYWDILFNLNERIVRAFQSNQIKIQPNKIEIVDVKTFSKGEKINV